jgi:hypothetical protein
LSPNKQTKVFFLELRVHEVVGLYVKQFLR